MKSWIVQRNEYDNGVAVVKNLIAQLGVKITPSTIEENLYASQTYPSLAALEEVLKKWGFATMAVKIPCDKLSEVVPPAIVFLESSHDFALIMSHANDQVAYIHPRIGWVTEPAGVFIEKWRGVLLMADPGEQSQEKDYETKLQREREKKENDPRLHNIKIIDNFLSDAHCSRLIEQSENLYKRSAMIKDGKIKIDEHRTSFTAALAGKDDIVQHVYRLATKVLRQPETSFEPLQCTSYGKGQEYRIHHDAFEDGSRELIERGQRESTLLIYLNDDFEGGETYFPELDFRVEPETGRALIFRNIDDGGDRDPSFFHAGLPVWSGTKYVANLWIRNNTYEETSFKSSEKQPNRKDVT